MDRPQRDDPLNTRPNDPLQDPRKDPDEWVTGHEPMTGPQRSYLETLARGTGEDIDPDMDKAEASKKIDELQEKTGRVPDRP